MKGKATTTFQLNYNKAKTKRNNNNKCVVLSVDLLSYILYDTDMNNYDEILLNDLAKKIKYHRNKIGLSQEKLAEKCDFDRTYISLLERAKRNPSYLSLMKLCIGLEIELIELLKEENSDESR